LETGSEWRDIIFSSNLNVMPFNRLLSVDNRLILIAHESYVFYVSSADVLHAFAIPSLGIKIDAVPGRLNIVSLKGAKAGVYYGQCSELCGYGHGFMPIIVEFVPFNDSNLNS